MDAQLSNNKNITNTPQKERSTIYFAGELFDHKHLTGNVLLAQKLEFLYGNQYHCILPQDLEKNLTDPLEIRNTDIATLMQMDLAIFNFDGTELDSGTVVEFMIAKMLDVPSVVLRTDFRNVGITESVRWNVMVYGYPRTAIVNYNCWGGYKKSIDTMHHDIAQEIHRAFEHIVNLPSVFTSTNDIAHAYSTMPQACGSGLSNILSPARLAAIVQSKINKGLYKLAQ